jgi:hypothetical protein
MQYNAVVRIVLSFPLTSTNFNIGQTVFRPYLQNGSPHSSGNRHDCPSISILHRMLQTAMLCDS